MSVKETAEAILATPDGEEHWGFCEAGVEFDDLQAMANLWLIKQAVITAMKDFRSSVNGEGGAAFADFAVDRFDRAMEALEDNDE